MYRPWLALCLALAVTGARAATLSNSTRQTFNGFGASGAWWPKDLALFPAEARADVARLLFDRETGLGLTDYRYNLGGGGIGVGTWERAPETPYVSDGVYDFDKDEAGTFFLREAARYEVPQITLFVNSAPTTFTDNNQSCGGALITDRIPAFATYLADVIGYWSEQGVNFTHVSPMNEPDNNFDDGDPSTLCGQEGMQVIPEQRAEVVTTLATALKDAGLDTQVIADESSSTGNFFADAPIWLSPEVGASLAAVAHHQYSFANVSRQAEMGELARNLSGGKPSWFSEICCYAATNSSQSDDALATIGWGQGYDLTMVSGLRMGNLIFQSLEYAEDEHWDWWTALSNGYGCSPSADTSCAADVRNTVGWDDGLIYYDPAYNTTQNYNLTITKRYTVLRHYAAAAPIGAVRRTVSAVEENWRVLAFDAPGACVPYAECGGAPYSVVAFNGQWINSTLVLGSGEGVELTQPKEVRRSSPTEDYVKVDVPVLEDGVLTVEAPAMSILTIFF